MLIALAMLLSLLALGTAVFLALGITATTLQLADGETLGGIAQTLVDRLNSSTLTAIPCFVVAAVFMQRSGMAAELVRAAEAWVSGLRSGLAVVVVIGAALFASISGSSTATALALGTILLPAMTQRGYPMRFNCGVVSASATLGILLPPSLALIVYGLVAGVPIPKLFLAGMMPALLQVLLFVGWILIATRKMPLVGKAQAFNLSESMRTSLRALPALAVPGIALGGIYSGIVTVSESAALAAATSIVISLSTGRCSPKLTLEWIADAIGKSTSILIIVGFAVLLGHWIILSGVPTALIGTIQAADISALEFLLLMNLAMFILGMFLEIVSTILITLPIVLPLLGPLGIDPIHYGIIVIVNMELAALTPPVGLNLFVMSSVAKVQVYEVVRGLAPFLILLLLLLAAVTLYPPLSLWLPGRL